MHPNLGRHGQPERGCSTRSEQTEHGGHGWSTWFRWHCSSCSPGVRATSGAVLAYALAAGLLCGGHAYIHDFALLLVVYAILAKPLPKPARIAFQLVLLPFVYAGLIGGAPYNVAVPLALTALMIWWASESWPEKNLI